MRNRPEFRAWMERLMAAWNRPRHADVVDTYWIALQGLSDDEFTAAASHALTHCDKWPVPKVLLGFGLEERGRLRRAAHHGPAPANGLPCCTSCGAQPAWHDLVTPSGVVIQRMITRHADHRPCAAFNQAHRWAEPHPAAPVEDVAYVEIESAPLPGLEDRKEQALARLKP